MPSIKPLPTTVRFTSFELTVMLVGSVDVMNGTGLFTVNGSLLVEAVFVFES